MAKTLYIMRHGETLFNRQKRVQGWCDSPLTENGLLQAEQARIWFKEEGIRFGAVYASTQERAVDTAQLVSGSSAVIRLKALKEMHFGNFEAQPEYLLPKFRLGARSFEDLLVPYGGEDIADVGKRVLQAVRKIAEEERSEAILIVSHGAALWGLILELDLTLPQEAEFGNCHICEYRFQAGELNLARLIDPIGRKEVSLV